MIKIITITYNDSVNLRRTLESVKKNKSQDMAYYVIDGASKDDTKTVIEEYENVIDYFISEPDKGLYDAMNKFHKLPGLEDEDFLLWLNAGDELLPIADSVLHKINQSDCAFFSVLVKYDPNDETGFLRVPKIAEKQDEKTLFPTSYFNHQGFLVKYKYIKDLHYRPSVGLQADVLFMTQVLCRIDISRVYVDDRPIAIFYMDGLSSQKHRSLLDSYFKVVRSMGYSLPRVIISHPYYLITQSLRAFLPNKLVAKIIKSRKRIQYENE